ncbi:MAG: thioredoxin domain-containing protein [Patescibacteria group bacterium]
MEQEEKKREYLLPVSIMVAAVLIAGSLVYSAGKRADTGTKNEPADGNPAAVAQPSPVNVKPVTAGDHILGDPNAPVKVIEFSDLECPFCKRFHYTMKQAVEAYDGKVAWVYRHSPIDQLHSKARKEAEASECAAELGGNEKFWAYLDRLFELTPSNNGLDLALLPTIATDVGLDKAKFESCLSSGKYATRIQSDLEDAASAGGGGTPYSVVLGSGGAMFVIPGALPFTSANPAEPSVKLVIDEALK